MRILRKKISLLQAQLIVGSRKIVVSCQAKEVTETANASGAVSVLGYTRAPLYVECPLLAPAAWRFSRTSVTARSVDLSLA